MPTYKVCDENGSTLEECATLQELQDYIEEGLMMSWFILHLVTITRHDEDVSVTANVQVSFEEQ